MKYWAVVSLLATSLAYGQNGFLREVWSQLDGSSLNELVNSPNYPDAPILSTAEADFRSPASWADRYGVRMRAYLTAPSAASYTFWISGDDQCELWLSPSDNPAAKVRIARVPSATGSDAWTTHAEQRSAPVTLAAGPRYYIEAVMKEGTGGDHLSVAWATSPTGTPVVISGAALTPFQAAGPAPTGLAVQAGRDISQYSPNFATLLSAQALHMANLSRTATFVWSQVSGSVAVIKTPSAGNTAV